MTLHVDTIDNLLKEHSDYTESQIIGIIWAITSQEKKGEPEQVLVNRVAQVTFEIDVGYKWIKFFESDKIVQALVMSYIYKVNLIKSTSSLLGLKYKELGEAIGYDGDSLRSIASKNSISFQLEKALLLFLENKDLKSQLSDCNELKKALKNLMK